ncbi:MAG TPA: hypothetical protein PKA64_20320 [Myxococcota bacterium]|nr:hypothetical protein [Myxococcota bacterium]
MTDPLARFNALVNQFSTVQGYIDQARALAHRFHPSVVERVVSGHNRTISDLLVDLVPAMADVEEAVQTLDADHDAIEAGAAESRLAVEELDLRHLIGDIDDASLAEQRAPHDERIASVAEQLSGIDGARAAMREALARWESIGRAAGVLQG